MTNYVIIPQENFGMQIIADDEQCFELITYSYMGMGAIVDYVFPLRLFKHLILKTEFWGESFFKLCKEIGMLEDCERAIFLNGDIEINVSALNSMFETAKQNDYDFFQAALTKDSYYSHDFLLKSESILNEKVPFIEIMMPGLSIRVIKEIAKRRVYTISGWGMDACLFRSIEKAINSNGQFCIMSCEAKHLKPVESHKTTYSNGKTAEEELDVFLRYFPHE